MSHLSLDFGNLKNFVSENDLESILTNIESCNEMLEKGQGPGSDFLGWKIPGISESVHAEIEDVAKSLRKQCEVFIVVGIGGSYIGAQAGLTFLKSSFPNLIGKEGSPDIYFSGHNISSDYHADLLELIEGRDICVNVISKSGTTTEPAIAFRFLKEQIEKKYGPENAKDRIVVTTDSSKGALNKLANENGYRKFVIPDDMGGRFSVLSPVGLLPLAVSGVDIGKIMAGASRAEKLYSRPSAIDNDAYRYAGYRHLLYQKGMTTEILATFQPALHHFAEWWKQLAGESEGKDLKGIFPASGEFTTDLHSMGQWIQEGRRTIFETFLLVENSMRNLKIPASQNDADGLNYLAGKTLDYVNNKAYEGTALAHTEGGVPNLAITIKDRSPESLGQLFYFFERAVAMTGYLSGVNPFDQPGVEFYKNNMFKLLNKPGY
ncbi:MAG: glucose-6-phosphate isomerase [Nitrospina sp.]|jgi:glucose-6-phosphate isomerase|nr:glucose-6-phosphate isomerase [Nitrospina sp.]